MADDNGPVGGHSDSHGGAAIPDLELPAQSHHLPDDFPLTYYAPKHTLPGPLPTPEEIRDAPRVSGPYCARVVFVRDHFAVKSGAGLPVNEAHALLLLERYPQVRAPRLYATWETPGTGVRHIVMQRIPGRSLEGVWMQMDDVEREGVCSQLREIFQTVRSIPPPTPAIFGSVSHGPYYQRWFWSPEKDPAVTGPFTRLEEFHAALAAVASGQADGREAQTQWAPALWTKHFAATMGGIASHKLACTFTHGDLHTQNIIVDVVENETDGAKSVRATGLVDWATAGWYPAYWEFAAWFGQFSTRHRDFGGWIDKILEPHLLEGFAIFGVSRVDGF